MALDEQIIEALEQNSTWNGSADRVWENIAAKLQPRKSWWQKRPLWLGTAAALLLALALRMNLPPPAVPEPKFAPRMQTFTALMPDEALHVQGGERIEIALDLRLLLAESETTQPPRLAIWRVNTAEGGEELQAEHPLAAADLVGDSVLTLNAPADPGTYRLIVQGVLQKEDGLYAISGEQRITVEK